MRTYCSLVISSNTDAQLQKTVQRVLGLKSDDVIDTQTSELIAQRERYNRLLQVAFSSPDRYFWRLSSKEIIDSKKLGDHIFWLLNQIHPGQSIREIKSTEAARI